MKTIIFSDLDGTLLDAKTYSFEAARPALGRIRSLQIPLVLCSSKTRAEIQLYQRRLGIRAPFVSENGGGVFAPVHYFSSGMVGEVRGGLVMTVIGLPYSRVRREFLQTAIELGVRMRGFEDMTPHEVSDLTGLPPEEAVLARQRDFSEPFVFEGSADERVFEAFARRGLHWTRGRLFCVMGDHDKGRAVRMLIKLYEAEHGRIISIGLGDALNDLPMLQEVDRPVLIPRDDGTYDPEVDLPGTYRAQGAGPVGWNRALLDIMTL
jgi:mannosyl-3-phosphoglycerate phosphatase